MNKFKDEERRLQNRVTELRMKKGVSESKMSSQLGKQRSYIQCITSGYSMPSFEQFFNICSYLEIDPVEFFEYDAPDPTLKRQVAKSLSGLKEDELILLLSLIEKIKK